MLARLATLSLALFSLTAAAPLEKKQHGVQVIETCSVSGDVALTFDDGPFNYENDISNSLNGAKATFFLNGNNYECIYNRIDQVRALHAAGHTLGSHTWSHADLTTLDWDGINSELEKVEQAFIRILGLKPLYFRPPYGSYNDLVLQVLGSRGYKKVFLWSDDTSDSDGGSVQQAKSTVDSVADNSPNPAIILMHSPEPATAYDTVPYAVGRLEGAGYQLVAVDTCLGGNGEWPYEYVGEPGTPDGSWQC